jgi:hypothetical protein
VFLTFDGLRDAKVRDRDTRVRSALQSPQAARLWWLLGERLTDDEKAEAERGRPVPDSPPPAVANFGSVPTERGPTICHSGAIARYRSLRAWGSAHRRPRWPGSVAAR